MPSLDMPGPYVEVLMKTRITPNMERRMIYGVNSLAKPGDKFTGWPSLDDIRSTSLIRPGSFPLYPTKDRHNLVENL
jgi:hypothetical protein